MDSGGGPSPFPPFPPSFFFFFSFLVFAALEAVELSSVALPLRSSDDFPFAVEEKALYAHTLQNSILGHKDFAVIIMMHYSTIFTEQVISTYLTVPLETLSSI